MAEVLAGHQGTYVAEDPDGYQWCIRCGVCEKALKGGYGNITWDEREALLVAHQAAMLAEAGYGKLGFEGGIWTMTDAEFKNELAGAWDEGCTTGNAHNGRRDANPYRSQP
jgi:hypothetical protein